MILADFYTICRPLIGRQYRLADYNCRHLACDFMAEMGVDAHNIFGIGKVEDTQTWRDSFKALRCNFVRVKTEPDFCLLLVAQNGENHVAIKCKNKVLHNFGRDNNGQALITDYSNIRDSYSSIKFYLIPVK